MKVIVDRQALLDILTTVSMAAASRTPREELTCIKVTAPAGGPLLLAAQDGSLSIAMTLPSVDIQEPDPKGLLFPAEKFRAIIASETSATITIEATPTVAKIRSNDGSYTLFLVDKEWPPISGVEEGVTLRLPTDDLQKILATLKKIAGSENTRYCVSGILFRLTASGVHIVATDGRRLALIERKEKTGVAASSPRSFVLPIRGAGIAERLCALGEGQKTATIKFGASDADISFHQEAMGLARIQMSLVEGAFPPYEDVIPKDLDIVARVDRVKFLRALDLASIMTSEDSKSVRFDLSGSECIMRSRRPEEGDAVVRFDLNAQLEGRAVAIGFNPRFMADAMSHASAAEMTMKFKSGGKPCMITGDIATHVIMPTTLDSIGLGDGEVKSMTI